MDIRMAVTDLDGTLLRGDKSLSTYTLRMIERVRAYGILFVVATARPIRTVKSISALRFDAGIFHNGAVVYDGAACVGKAGIENPREIALRILRDRPDCGIGIEAEDVLYEIFDAGSIWPGLSYTYTRDFSELSGKTADKILVRAGSAAELESFRAYLPENLYIQLSENAVGMVMNRAATKLNGIRCLAARHGIAMEEIVAFGDDLNDVEMLRGCGCGVAVVNAPPQVKEAANTVCAEGDADGVARWLEKNCVRVKAGRLAGGLAARRAE